jgi:CheY-like chemotaxis protein
VRSALRVRDAILDFAPDIVLLDIGMPEMSGYEVARTLRKVYGSARPVLVALTARTDEMDKRIAQLSGFDHHVGKPYEPDALLQLLATIIARRGRKHG